MTHGKTPQWLFSEMNWLPKLILCIILPASYASFPSLPDAVVA
jgi:hypothetical protein